MPQLRLLVLAMALLWIVMPASAQDEPAPAEPTRRIEVPLTRTGAKPVQDLPHTDAASRSKQLAVLGADTGLPGDTLSDEQILRRISRLYRYQADILAAEAEYNSEHAEGLLELAMTDLATLAEQPGIMERPRFRELYRSLVTEYERYYGVADSVLAVPYGSLFQFRADMFAALNELEDPLLEDVMLPELPAISATVPMTTNRLVESSMQYLLRNPDKHINNWLRRAETYLPMIEQIFREEGVPDELKYLAMIESGLVPRARSWAQAAGMWQFVAATGRAYGLQVNPWVDERLDPEKATRAAAKHLKDLYQMYDQDWHVALAGYNCSPRCIKRAIRQSGKAHPTYWDIYDYLPRETRNYVPMFIATSLIASNPSHFGLTVQPAPRFTYDMVPVQGMISLDDVAEMAGTSVAVIKALNPELMRDTLPPTSGAYLLKIPEGHYQQFAEALAQLPEAAKRPAGEYVVRRGDSLGKIATQHGVSVTALRNANGISGGTIHPGQRLVVPVATVRSAVTLADAQPRTVQYGVRVIQPITPLGPLAVAEAPRETPTVTSSTSSAPTRNASTSSASSSSSSRTASAAREERSSDTRVVYRVRRGDTLGKIAQKYGVSINDLKSWNNLRGTQINSGQQLTLYTSGTVQPSQPERVVYRVRRGDNLTEIAQKYGVTVTSIKSWNNLRSSTIRTGQRLTIHPGQSAPSYSTYTVRRGDSLGKIASRHGTTVSNLKRWNSLRSSTIQPGQRLKIYN